MSLASILITGGGSGIGAALAQRLAARGCRVLISGRRRDALDEVAAGAPQIDTCLADVTDACQRAELVERFGALEAPRGLFHAAGYFQTGLLNDLEEAAWQRSFDTNVTARFLLSRACVDLLDGGRLLFIGSDAGANPRAGGAAYSVAQAASETLRRALQREWADRNVAVGAFKPGLVDTNMVRGFMALPKEVFPARDAYQQYVERGEVATAETIARFAAWLLMDVPTDVYAETEWDIRNTAHHQEWADGPLFSPLR